MIVQIKKSKDHLMWYYNLIGSEWFVLRQDSECYYVRDIDNRLNIIYKKDTH